jgi:hypothetical protein
METLAKLIGVLVIIAITILLLSFPVMWLWNWLMPTLFGLTEINWLQSVGLLLLINLLKPISVSPPKD